MVDNPHVGANLMDHPGTLIFLAPTDPAFCDPGGPAYQIGIRWSSGLGAENDMLTGMMNYWDTRFDPDLHQAAGADYIFALTAGCHEPRSRGRLRLVDADPTTAPAIDFDMLSARIDEDRLVEGLRLLRRLARSQAMKPVARDILLVDEAAFEADDRGDDSALRALRPRDARPLVPRQRNVPDGAVAGAGRGGRPDVASARRRGALRGGRLGDAGDPAGGDEPDSPRGGREGRRPTCRRQAMIGTGIYDFDRLLIGSQWSEPATAERLEIRSPASGEPVGSAPEATSADVDAAVAAARRAFDEGPWPHLTMAERVAALTPVRERLGSLFAELDVLATRENGVPIAVQPTLSAVAVLDWYLTEAAHLEQTEQRTGAFGTRGTIYREPVGVVAGIVPWNGPLLQAVGKLAPALLTGCTAVLKPAPETPLTSLLLAGLFADAGLPDGVVSILPGNRDTGRHLVSHTGVDAVAFTGSTAAGRLIAEETGRTLKRSTLELGGKSAAVVLDDADPAATAALVALGCMAYSGQACAALTRALIPAARYDEFAEAIDAAIGAMPVGDPLDPATVIGPLVAERQLKRVLQYIESGIQAGAEVLRGGGRLADRPEGWFVEPTIFSRVDNGMLIAQEEIFGPVLCLIPYETEADAVRIANDTQYGLSGAVFGSDDERATRVARALRTGSVGINALAGDVGLPFGGFKCSGIGREFSRETFDHFTELKTVARMDTVGFGLMSA